MDLEGVSCQTEKSVVWQCFLGIWDGRGVHFWPQDDTREGPAPLLKIISVVQYCYFMFRRTALSLKLSFCACMTAIAIDWLSQNKHTDFWVLVVSAVRPKNRSFGRVFWESGWVGMCIFGHRTAREGPAPLLKLFPWPNVAILCSAGPLSV